MLGSFIATLVLRAGEGRPVTGRSTCDGCGKPLTPIQLVPLVSWLLQRGRCNICAARIDPLHPFTETAAALIGGASLWLAPYPAGLALALFGLLLLTLALFDARHFWLPHWLSAVTAVAGLLLSGVAMQPLGLAVALIDRLIGLAIGFAVLWLVGGLYQRLRGRQGLGGGDAPMFAALGAWLGWAALPWLLLFATLAGLAITLTRQLIGQAGAAEPWQTLRLPLGTLLALATPVTVLLLALARPLG